MEGELVKLITKFIQYCKEAKKKKKGFLFLIKNKVDLLYHISTLIEMYQLRQCGNNRGLNKHTSGADQGAQEQLHA